MPVAKIIKLGGRCPASLQVAKGVSAPCSKTDGHDGPHRSSDNIEFSTHPAGCACGPCHNERMSERTQPLHEPPPGACGVRDGASGRVCLRESGHAGIHATGYRLFADPKPEEPKKKRARKEKPAAKPETTAAKGEAVAQPPKPCGKRWERAADRTRLAKDRQIACERKMGHDGPHRAFALEGNHVSEWTGDGSRGGLHIPKERYEGRTLEELPGDPRPRAQRCFCCGEGGKAEPHELGAPVVCKIPDHDMCMCAGGEERTHMLGAPGCEPARQQREAREAHAAKVEAAAKEPSLADTCPKCGRELGEHDGKKCPKPTKVTKVNAKATPALEHATHCGYCQTLLDDDGMCAACLSGKTPFEIKRDRASLILGMRRHPAAALFPLLEGEAFERFADRIQANGLRDPIVLVTVDGEDWILDGSNRGLACEQRGIAPRFEPYKGPTDIDSLVTYSLDKNGDGRRHLDPSVRAMIAADASKLGPGNPGDRQTGRSAGLMTQAEAGKRLGVSERLVRKAVAVRDKGTPKVKEAVMKGKLAVEAAEQVTKLPRAKQDEIAERALAKAGQIKSGQVRALVKQEEKRAVVRKINTEQVAPAPIGPYRLIVADFPWPYDNSDQHEGSRGHIPYPAMPIEQGIALASELDKLADEDGCVLAFWTTNAFMPDAVRMVEAWGFTWRTIFTWDKERDGIGTWGRGRTEHLIIAERGEVEAHTLNEVSTLLRAPRREHSRKPDEMMTLLEQHCPGPRLEMFAREPRSGWAAWGAETQKFSGAA